MLETTQTYRTLMKQEHLYRMHYQILLMLQSKDRPQVRIQSHMALGMTQPQTVIMKTSEFTDF